MDRVSTDIEGVYVINYNPQRDARGFFVRNHDVKEFTRMDLGVSFVQSSLSFNLKRGTLRGLHYQKAPFEETKLIQCLSGAIYDVILDLRPESKTYKKWQTFELSLESQNALYVPAGCAHGFLTLTDGVLIQYRMNCEFQPDHQGGVRWNDPQFAINWPSTPAIVSERDQKFLDWKP